LTIRRKREEERIYYNIVEIFKKGDFLINGKWA